MGGELRKSRIGLREIDDSTRRRISMQASGRATARTRGYTLSSQGIIDRASRGLVVRIDSEKPDETLPVTVARSSSPDLTRSTREAFRYDRDRTFVAFVSRIAYSGPR